LIRTLVLAVVLIALGAGAGRAEPRRFAVVIGEVEGGSGDERLLFAEDDATQVASLLKELGGFRPEDVVVLTRTTAAEVRRVLIGMNTRLRDVSDSLLFVFYSGHADAENLHLGASTLPTSELRDLIYGSAATARILVIDACRSGGVTRRKGGHAGPAFAIDLDEQLRAEGVAILTSSAASEDSQESDALRASFFTHFLVSALRGAADANSDGEVTLAEAFTYASEHTLAATARSLAGPQHPSYRYDLSGRDALVLTRLGHSSVGRLAFDQPGSYLVQRADQVGTVVAELDVVAERRVLALPPATYDVTRRDTSYLLQGKFAVTAAATTSVSEAKMNRVAYAQVVRKGGTKLRRIASLFAAGGVRTGYAQLSAGPWTELGARLDTGDFAVELRASVGWMDHLPDSTKTPRSGSDVAVVVTALRAIDVGHFALSGGVAVGAFRITREPGLDTVLYTERYGAIAGGVAQAQHALWRNTFLRIEAAALGHLFTLEDGADQSGGFTGTLVWSATLGLGAFL
jgi:hypothetical protein